MTDSAEAGSVAAETSSAGAPAQPNASEANGSSSAADTPFSGLQDEGARKWVETKGYKTVDDVVSAAHSLETKLGTAFTAPAADAPKEEWDRFWTKLPEDRRPIASPDKLEFKRPEGLPENVPYSAELAEASRSWMHEAELNPKQAQVVHDKFVGYMAEQAQAQQAAMAKSVEETHDALVKEWGPQDSEGFKTKLELANRAMKKLGLVDAYKAKGILLPDGALTDQQIAVAFSAIGEAMFKEDSIGSDGISGGENPFKKQPRNVTEISALGKRDLELARRMAREAGENPDTWFPQNPL